MTSIFHKFIEVAAAKPPETSLMPEFAYMEQEIRKSYKQLKNSKGLEKPCEEFIDYWKEIGALGREEQVTIYFRWIELIQKSIADYIHPELPTMETDLYVKKSLISKWQSRRVKLNGLVLQIFSKRLKQFPLKCFCIRKSKNKDHFSWVMEVVTQIQGSKYKLKSFHLGSNNVNEYQEWYRQIENRIDIARIYYFKEIIDIASKDNIKIEDRGPKPQKVGSNGFHSENRAQLKTLTQLVIDKELKNIEECEGLTIIEDNEKIYTGEEEFHPNIFVKIFPKIDLTNFCQNPTNATLLECQKEYSLYEVDGSIKIYITFGRSLSVVFRAISESHKNWNPEIDTFNIKNKISCENSIFVYQKDKAKGFLYRQRDYFFLRHCFTLDVEENKQKLFMIEKSIDSIHNPPFMTVARGEKSLIWCVVGDKAEKECLLIVQGIIKGGGYMNATEDRENTIKYFKKLAHLDNYLKQIEVSQTNKDGFLFREDWLVSFKQENAIRQEDQEQFYSPREVNSEQFQASNLQRVSKRDMNQQSVYLSPRQQNQSKFNQFIEQTAKENVEKHQEIMQQAHPTLSTDFTDQYISPQINQDGSVKIASKYLKQKHILSPKPKGKEKFAQKIRGHHLWKGEWAVAEAGGLNYIDEQKMRQQKKVLTFIIKRIGKNILSGKGILNVSLPVDIFCRQSNIERLAMSFGYFPLYLQKVVEADPIEQMKAIIAATMGSSHIYLTMEKPFNPILGETYQCWIDGCPIYFQQISHHPPIAAYLMKGRGYQISGSVQAKMDLSINSGTGVNEGIFTVKFDSGRKFHYTTPPGQLSGLTYGERKLLFVEKIYFWSVDEGLFLEVVYNPQSKQSRFFSNSKTYVGQEKLADYFEGMIRKYRPADLNDFLATKKKDNSKQSTIPKSLPPHEPVSQCGKISGRWTKQVYYDKQKLFDVQTCVQLKGYDEKYPLPSHSNFREDVVYRRLNEIVKSQEWKEILEVRQRRDRKLREENAKKKK